MMHQIAPKEQQIKCFTLKKKIERRRKKIGGKKKLHRQIRQYHMVQHMCNWYSVRRRKDGAEKVLREILQILTGGWITLVYTFVKTQQTYTYNLGSSFCLKFMSKEGNNK